ncbi:hypothetical protein ACW9HC_34525 [Nocardia gipuzkoensis]
MAAADILAVWERIGTQPVPMQACAMLDAFRQVCGDDGPGSGGSVGAPATLPLGARDAALLRMFTAAFGDRLDALARCPICGIDVEVTLSCRDFLDRVTGVTGVTGDAVTPVTPVTQAGYVVEWRLPTSADLAALGGCRDADEAGDLLLQRCVLDARRDGATVTTTDLPGFLRAAVGTAMAEADPLAEIRLDLACPECGRRWTGEVDVGMFLARHLESAARRVFADVHTLAGAYGWSEADILALSPARRVGYLRLVNGA